MASLINCQQVAAYTAEEFAGDTAYGAATLELQSPPAGALETSAIPLYYYLTIESESGYHIKAENINIGGVNGEFQQQNGIYQWTDGSIVTGSVVPSDILNIRTMDSLADNTDCSNKVIVEIVLQPSFTMPANDHFINIDFGGTAQSCAPLVDPVVDPRMQFELFLNSNADTYSFQDGQFTMLYSLYVAKYFDSEQYAASVYNDSNYTIVDGEWTYNACSGNQPPDYDFNQCWNDEDFFNVSDSCLDSFQPTCYGKNRNGSTSFGPLSWFDVTNTNNVTTTCGALGISNIDNVFGSAPTGHPNIAEFNYFVGESANPYQPIMSKEIYRFRFSSGAVVGNSWYLSQVDYPFLVPGDGILPPYLCWYISVGNDSNWDLIASTETIDVWKIVSTTYITPFNNYTWTGGAPITPDSVDCSIFGTSGVLISEKNSSGVVIQNNSNLDISNIEITQIDSKTIKLKIPFQSDFQAEIWDDQFARNTKIFLNVYPTEI